MYLRLSDFFAKEAHRDKGRVCFASLAEQGLRRLEVDEGVVFQEGCSRSPEVLIAEYGQLITHLKYQNLKAVSDFFIKVLAYADEASMSQPNPPLLTDDVLTTLAVENEFLLFCNEDEFKEIARSIEAKVRAQYEAVTNT